MPGYLRDTKASEQGTTDLDDDPSDILVYDEIMTDFQMLPMRRRKYQLLRSFTRNTRSERFPIGVRDRNNIEVEVATPDRLLPAGAELHEFGGGQRKVADSRTEE